MVVKGAATRRDGDALRRTDMPWLAEALERAHALKQAHAVLVHGPAGAGHLEFALLLAQHRLCEAPGNAPCGACTSCHLVRSRAHPDLLVVVPDALRTQLGWTADADGAATTPDAKASREVRVLQIRQAIVWGQTSTGRGRGKVLVLHPADAMNAVAANALLKTLEEPPGQLRMVLTSVDPERLLPTVRSRCQRLALGLPALAVARSWLVAQGVGQPDAVLALAGGSPIEALALVDEGIDADWCAALPGRVASGDAALLRGRTVPRVIELLGKLAHDAIAVAAGSLPRYFPAGSVPEHADAVAWSRWLTTLMRSARHDEHPWNAPLLVESLVTQAAALWPAAAGRAGARRPGSLNSPR